MDQKSNAKLAQVVVEKKFCKDCKNYSKDTKMCRIKNDFVPRKGNCEVFDRRQDMFMFGFVFSLVMLGIGFVLGREYQKKQDRDYHDKCDAMRYQM